MSIWQSIVGYYTNIGEKYRVDPLIFFGIHLVATPLFAAAVAWIIYYKKKKRSILIPSIVAIFIFNAASIYLITYGRGIPFYIYAIVATSAIVSGYLTYKKVRKKLQTV